MQLESGLVACGLTAHMKNSPEIWHSLFGNGNMFQVSAEEILDDMIITYSNLVPRLFPLYEDAEERPWLRLVTCHADFA